MNLNAKILLMIKNYFNMKTLEEFKQLLKTVEKKLGETIYIEFDSDFKGLFIIFDIDLSVPFNSMEDLISKLEELI